jgi:hypothetical protein
MLHEPFALLARRLNLIGNAFVMTSGNANYIEQTKVKQGCRRKMQVLPRAVPVITQGLSHSPALFERGSLVSGSYA